VTTSKQITAFKEQLVLADEQLEEMTPVTTAISALATTLSTAQQQADLLTPTLVTPPVLSVPGAITHLTAAPNGTSVVLSWTNPTGGTGVNIFQNGVKISSPGGVSTHTVTGLAVGTYTFGVQSTNGAGVGPEATIMATVAGVILGSIANQTGTQGTALTIPFSASSGQAPYFYTLVGAGVPGLSIVGAALTGTPTGSGTYTLTVEVTDSTTPTAGTAERTFTLTIAPPSVSGQIIVGGRTGFDAAGEAAWLAQIGATESKSCCLEYTNTGPTWSGVNNLGSELAFGAWTGSKVLKMPMQVTNTPLTWTDVTSGANDQYITPIAQWCYLYGVQNICPGWEFNGNWYPWGCYGNDTTANQEGFVATWIHIWNLFNEVAPGYFHFWWEPDWEGPGPTAMNMDPNTSPYYPGDAYVWGIGFDLYNTWNDGAWPGDATVLAAIESGPQPNWNTYSAYCVAHSKAMVVPEWGISAGGVNGGDDPTYVQNVWNLALATAALGVEVFMLIWNNVGANPWSGYANCTAEITTLLAAAVSAGIVGGNGSAPAAPTGLTAIPAGSTVTLTWVNPIGTTSNIILENGAQIADVTGETTYTVPGLAGGSYSFAVAASNATGTGPATTPVSVTVSSTHINPLLAFTLGGTLTGATVGATQNVLADFAYSAGYTTYAQTGASSVPAGQTLMLSVGALTPSQATAIAQQLVAGGQPNAIIRPMWEMDQNSWFPLWNQTALSAAQFISTWTALVNAMRAVAGANFTFMWCCVGSGPGVPVATGRTQFDTYPGSAYVDYIAIDIFDNLGTVAAATSQVQTVITYASEAGKPWALAEWAVINVDDPAFIVAMAALVTNGTCGLQNYYSFTAFNTDLTTFPKSLAAYEAAFGTTTPQQGLKVTTPGPQSATVGVEYSYVFAATGGSGNYSWAITNQPAGLTLTAATLSGEPTAAVTSQTVTVTVTDTSTNATATATFTFTVAAATSNPSGIPMPTGTVTTAGGTWTPIMSEDFNGTTLNSANWDAPYNDSHPGNQASQGTWLASHVSVSNSMLILQASIDNSFSNPAADNWAFGGVYCAHGLSFGRWEVCMRADPSELIFALALIIGAEWPSPGEVCEIDMIEGASANGTTFPAVGFTTHYGSAPSQIQYQEYASWNEWNVVALEFTESTISYYLNGTLVTTFANPAPNASQQTMYLTLQNQLEEGPPPGGTPSAQQQVDWVVIYEPA
jgi:hypothetical protein